MKFEARPDYRYLLQIFEDQMKEQEIEIDYVFDWHIQKEKIIEDKKKAIEEEK